MAVCLVSFFPSFWPGAICFYLWPILSVCGGGRNLAGFTFATLVTKPPGPSETPWFGCWRVFVRAFMWGGELWEGKTNVSIHRVSAPSSGCSHGPRRSVLGHQGGVRPLLGDGAQEDMGTFLGNKKLVKIAQGFRRWKGNFDSSPPPPATPSAIFLIDFGIIFFCPRFAPLVQGFF